MIIYISFPVIRQYSIPKTGNNFEITYYEKMFTIFSFLYFVSNRLNHIGLKLVDCLHSQSLYHQITMCSF